MEKLYADVEYFGIVYRDAELVAGTWYFQSPHAGLCAFAFQDRVKPLHEPQPQPRLRRTSKAAGSHTESK